MIQQPELGKKIADLRKERGLTQEELVDKCNLNVRTLQRIESGEVTPRTYTVRLIFEALDFPLVDSQSDKGLIKKWLDQFYISFIDLFNLKTNTMKKITFISVVLILMFVGVYALSSEINAQKREKVIEIITNLQNKNNKWINEGQIDSIMTLYHEDACVLPLLSGKTKIRGMIQSAIDDGYKLIDFQTLSISVGDSIAVQKYFNTYEISGELYKQKGIAEWRFINGNWKIINDIFISYQ